MQPKLYFGSADTVRRHRKPVTQCVAITFLVQSQAQRGKHDRSSRESIAVPYTIRTHSVLDGNLALHGTLTKGKCSF